MGDWDYINDHMGGFDEDGLPNFMNSPHFLRKDSQSCDYTPEFYFSDESLRAEFLKVVSVLRKEIFYALTQLMENPSKSWKPKNAYKEPFSLLYARYNILDAIEDALYINNPIRKAEFFAVFIHPEKHLLTIFTSGESRYGESGKYSSKKEDVHISRDVNQDIEISDRMWDSEIESIFSLLQSTLLHKHQLDNFGEKDFKFYIEQSESAAKTRNKILELLKSTDNDIENTKKTLKDSLTNLSKARQMLAQFSGSLSFQESRCETIVAVPSVKNPMSIFQIDTKDNKADYMLYELDLTGEQISRHHINLGGIKKLGSTEDGVTYTIPLSKIILFERERSMIWMRNLSSI